MSKEAKDFKAKVQEIASKSGLPTPTESLVFVTLEVYRPARRGDLDNSIKVTLDALKGIAFVDDAQVVELCAQRYDDKADPRVRVTVTAVEQPLPC